MCLIFSALFFIMSVNFYLNGFTLQAIITFIAALLAVFFMGRNIRCGIGGCKLETKEEDKDDN